jgi:hypothetical protein
MIVRDHSRWVDQVRDDKCTSVRHSLTAKRIGCDAVPSMAPEARASE